MCCCGSLGRWALFAFLLILMRKNIYYNVYCSFIHTSVETFNISHNSSSVQFDYYVYFIIFSDFTKLYDHHHKSVWEHFIAQIRSLIIGDWNAKAGNQETPEVTGKFGLGVQNEAGQKLTEFCQETALVIANTLFQQHKRRLYTWTSPDGQHQNQIDYSLCSQRWRSYIQSAKTRPGDDCGSDHELLIAKFRLNWRKWGKRLDHLGMT